MKVHIQKWGNSLAVRIPKPVASEAGLKEGSAVELRRKGRVVVIAPIRKPRYTLDELLAGITKNNLHAEVDFGPPVGKEQF